MKKLILTILLMANLQVTLASEIEKRFKIAVIDTGIKAYAVDQPYMCKGKMWYTNYVNHKYDEIGHGQSMVDIISRNMDVNKYCIVPIMWFDRTTGKNSAISLVEALKIANKINPHIVNMSLSGVGYNKEEFQEIVKLLNKRVVINFASGNDSQHMTYGSCDIYPNCHIKRLTLEQQKFFNSVTSIELRSSNRGYGVKLQRTGIGLDGKSGTSEAAAWYTNELVRNK